MTRAVVSVRRGRPVGEMVREAMEAAGAREAIAAGDRVLVKPNLVRPAVSATGVTTSLEVVEAVVAELRSLGAEPVVGESSGVPFETAAVFRALGADRLAERLGARLVDFDTYPSTERRVDRPLALDPVVLTSLVDEVDAVVSVPVAKTHNVTDVTGAVKNLHGLVPDWEKWRTHWSGVDRALVDIARAARPALSVLDATVCLEGHGPMTGDPVRLDTVAASRDAVALDAVEARMLGFEPARVRHLALAAEAGLGSLSCELEGDEPPRRAFRRARFVAPMRLAQQAWTRVQYALKRRLGLDTRRLNRGAGGLILQRPRFTARCTGCGRCVEACPAKCLSPGRPPRADLGRCLRCGACWAACPVEGAAGYSRSLRWLIG